MVFRIKLLSPPNTVLLDSLEGEPLNSSLEANMEGLLFTWVYFALFWKVQSLGKDINFTDTNIELFMG